MARNLFTIFLYFLFVYNLVLKLVSQMLEQETYYRVIFMRITCTYHLRTYAYNKNTFDVYIQGSKTYNM